MTSKKPTMARFVLIGLLTSVATAEDPWHRSSWTMIEGGVVRGDGDRRELALVFTADEFGEGTPLILDTLLRRHEKASFFVTGTYLDDPKNEACFRRMVAEGHYVGHLSLDGLRQWNTIALPCPVPTTVINGEVNMKMLAVPARSYS